MSVNKLYFLSLKKINVDIILRIILTRFEERGKNMLQSTNEQRLYDGMGTFAHDGLCGLQQILGRINNEKYQSMLRDHPFMNALKRKS